ncbi:uncharacterized protein LOC113204879 isoform X2 [Frankliniella occidentalis]|uniref:Uncharacterized protein LOC113204879 isoform X2 n=1 Tax=Frankliniella occidentalis TaxID=133901 RepID=A0A9C6X840_FRAOC|nr:uncharacterized protein LOC113204879 isoform X2 [Frankliniella occidentalis]
MSATRTELYGRGGAGPAVGPGPTVDDGAWSVEAWCRWALSFTVTAMAFGAVLLLLPALLLMYSVVSRVRTAWLGVLERRYPQLEFVRNTTVRTAVDTIRNQGVIALLLTVQGACDPRRVMDSLHRDILDQRHPDGRLRFPHLRTPLSQRWGRYAWKRDDAVHFQLDKQLLLCSAAFRGRPVTDNNIQEVVSDLVSKYLVPELPPWQIALIPMPSADRYFVLIRMHHLLLSEDGLKLTDLLQLTRQHSDFSHVADVTPAGHLLEGMLEAPVAIPALYERLGESVANHWNELIAVYDPLENPKVLTNPTLLGLSMALLIAVVSAVPEVWRGGRWDGALGAVRAQAARRGVSSAAWRAAVGGALWRTLTLAVSPPVLALSAALFGYRLWRGAGSMALRIVLVLALEAALLTKYRGRYTESLMSRSPYLRLWWQSLHEAMRLAETVFRAPRLLVEDLLLSNRNQPPHHFQTVSLCGRKVVAWSDPFPQDLIQQMADATGASSSEVCLSALSGALREYFRSHGLAVPENVLTTARYCLLEELVGGPAQSGSGGLACIALPVADAVKDPVQLVHEVRARMARVRRRQAALWVLSSWQLERGLLTRLLPQLLVRLHLNFLSRRYAVALTEVASLRPDHPAGKLWGHPLQSLMYWRPPQANVSLSLTLLTVDSMVSLGVMADALLSPQQGVIARAWTQHLRDLARAVGVSLPSPRALSPSPQPPLPAAPVAVPVSGPAEVDGTDDD